MTVFESEMDDYLGSNPKEEGAKKREWKYDRH